MGQGSQNLSYMRILILLTTSFPYGSKETFIESELPIMCHSFDKVITYALYDNDNIREIDYPDNYYHYSACSTKRERVLSILKVILIIEFWKELLYIIRSRTHVWPRMMHLIKFTSYAITPYATIVKSIKQWNKDSDDNELYFYSYWLVEHAFLALKLKNKFCGSLSFSRAHGYDLYESRDKYGYIPYRRYLCNQLDYVFPISENGKKLLEGYGGRADVVISRLGTIDYGLSPFEKDDKQLTIVSCSWCAPVKRINLIIEALSLIKSKPIKWIHIGDGAELTKLQSLASERLKDNITFEFKGRLSNQDIICFYQVTSVDLFINVSSSEGIPVSIMEAQSFGIPTIATNVGGVSEIVVDSYNGWLLNVDCKPETISRILDEYACMSDWEIGNLRHHARDLWNEKYNANTNYKDFYSGLTKELK